MARFAAQSVLMLREGLLFRSWGDRAVVFDPESNATFLLEGVGAESLELMMTGGTLTVGELEHHLIAMLEDPLADTEDLRLQVQETLAVFSSRAWLAAPRGSC